MTEASTEKENEEKALSNLWNYFWSLRQSDLEEADEWGFCSKKQFTVFMVSVLNMLGENATKLTDEEE